VAGQLFQQPSGSSASGVPGSIDRRLKYAVGDLRDERGQRVDGSERDPERSEYVHVVLLQSSDADTRAACQLHTLNLWQSHADPNGHSDGDSHTDSNANGCAYTDGYTNGCAYTDGYANGYAYTDSYANSDAYTNCDTNTDGNFNTRSEVYTDAQTTSDTAASTLGVRWIC
jgi:hypothetical protein